MTSVAVFLTTAGVGFVDAAELAALPLSELLEPPPELPELTKVTLID